MRRIMDNSIILTLERMLSRLDKVNKEIARVEKEIIKGNLL